MPAHQPKGPFCQSCGMPMEKPKDFGTDASGITVRDYCRYCYSKGQFTEPTITMPGMLEKCVSIMTQQGIMAAPVARTLMAGMLPELKRWRGPAEKRH